MFYSYYSNVTIKTCGDRFCNTDESQMIPYSIPTAYFFTIGIAFFIICIILVYRLEGGGGGGVLYIPISEKLGLLSK